ncbi:putative glutathione-dependent formaldehyde-activating enzyme [Diplogelasinospora grovesii]|uniref:Glutathione-dependent formaldehyde-activating enzyme n=1 Tax=Diplogelasinospora grovesii TaxID=303347 RepID=A0AAN6N780_9PEZI|nr:putative glutathione-dependent formaldehyde-activating enzyme [Diplogelasinospora grovesii]
MASSFPFPTPKFIEGGCLCGALRYRVDFPEGHDFSTASGTCQCTQCRKQTSSLFLITHTVRPASTAFRFTSLSTSTLKHYSPTARAERGFCSDCGSLLYWRPTEGSHICVTVGTIDPLYLFGQGADGKEIPQGGFGMALTSGGGHHLFCSNEIPGVTDRFPFLGRERGTRFPEDD